MLISKHFESLPWYMMPISERKSFLIILMKAQQVSGLELPLIGLLNVETFTNVCKNFEFKLTY